MLTLPDRPFNTLLTRSGKLSVTARAGADGAGIGVGGAVLFTDSDCDIESDGLFTPDDVPGDRCRFIADTRGGDGARVEEECVPLVKSLEIEAVAVDVPASATGAGVRGINAGDRNFCPLMLAEDDVGCGGAG